MLTQQFYFTSADGKYIGIPYLVTILGLDILSPKNIPYPININFCLN